MKTYATDTPNQSMAQVTVGCPISAANKTDLQFEIGCVVTAYVYRHLGKIIRLKLTELGRGDYVEIHSWHSSSTTSHEVQLKIISFYNWQSPS